jgi:hypothetical protein
LLSTPGRKVGRFFVQWIEGGTRPPDGLVDARHTPRPLLLTQAEGFPDRIQPDIRRFLLQVVLIADAMIEEISLPWNAKISGLIGLPFPDHFAQRFVVWKAEQGMQVVGHEQEQSAVPSSLHVIEFGRLQQDRGNWFGR